VTLFIIPQLPVKGRYQEHWIWWWMDELKRLHVDHYFILPENWTVYIDKTKYFAPNDREYFAPTTTAIDWDGKIISRLADVLNFIRDDDYLLILDFDYTGALQGLLPLLKRYNEDIKIGAYVHAGAWAPKDYFNRIEIGEAKKYIEYGAIRLLNNLFTPTMDAKRIMLEYLCYDMCRGDWGCQIHCINNNGVKVHVVGSLWRPYKEINEALKKKEEMISKEKWLKESRIVVINGRYGSLDHDILRRIVNELRGKVTLVATDKWVARRYDLVHMNYFEALSVAKVMLQPKIYDTFGLAVVEALYTRTVPVLPEKNVYKEVYGEYVWDDLVEGVLSALDKYEKYVERTKISYEHIYDKWLQAPEKIVKIAEDTCLKFAPPR